MDRIMTRDANFAAAPSRALRGIQKGLTLVEIVIVLVILSVLIAFLTQGLFAKGQGAKANINKMKLTGLKDKINQYQLMYNALPQDLQSLVSCNEQTGSACIPIAQEEDLLDIFGTRIIYTSEGTGRFVLKSLGADKKDGGSGADGDFVLAGP